MNFIPFNKPYLTGKETQYISNAVRSGKISGNGIFTQKCHEFFEKKYGFKKCLLTTSCTDALEMAAILLDIKQGDEVIMPSFTFVSTANAFVLRGANIRFADCNLDNPNINIDEIENLINPKTKAIVVVHYAGIACQMDEIMQLAEKHKIFVVEDAAQAIESFYKNKPLGSIGHLAAFSFHETKNVIAGEGGMLVVNDERFFKRAEIIWEKGTNRAAFYRGEIDKYGWVDIGSSFLPSELTAAFLYAQLECIDSIQKKRLELWNLYAKLLAPLFQQNILSSIKIPSSATNNAHLFAIICKSLNERTRLIKHLKDKNVLAVFHYLPLHSSSFYQTKHDGRLLKNTQYYSDHLLRLPLFYELTTENVEFIVESIFELYK